MTNRKKVLQLYNHHEVPEFLQSNPYILSGYRLCLSPNRCLKSIFVWTNETLNIWTHLLGFLIFAVLLVYYNMYRIPEMGGDFWDHVVVSSCLVCYQFCMISSVGYHTFNCQSRGEFCRWLMVDLNGISIGMVGCYIAGVYYGFYCDTFSRNVYLGIITLLSALILFKRKYQGADYEQEYKQSFVLYAILSLFGLVPMLHLVVQYGWSSDYLQLCLAKLVKHYALLALAVLVYLGRAPERFLPGQFDFIGSSHQWWHLLIIVCLLHWITAMQDVNIYWKIHACAEAGL